MVISYFLQMFCRREKVTVSGRKWEKSCFFPVSRPTAPYGDYYTEGGLYINLGRNIRSLRQQQKLTQKAFAIKLNVTEAAISRWENDVCYPDIALLPDIANILKTSIDALLQ